MRFLDIAVHCHVPPLDGADRRAWELYNGLGETGAEGVFIGRTATTRTGGALRQYVPDYSWRDRKLFAASLALLTGQSYWHVKMIRPGAMRLVADALAEKPDVVLLNHLYAMPLADPVIKSGVPLVVDTHNYDPVFYDVLAKASTNPGLRQLCRRAIRFSEKSLARLPKGTILVHVSEADAQRYRQHRPDLEHAVVENGASIKPRREAAGQKNSKRPVLMFVGSLSAQMNQDALANFASRFWPALSEVAEFRAVGSGPPPAIAALCARHGWQMFADVSEEKLDELYAEADFAILPFAYGEGSKLKFFEACGRGVPVLSTQAGLCGVADDPLPVLVTKNDDPAIWKSRIAARGQFTEADVRDLIEFSERYSWPVLGKKLRDVMDQAASKTRAVRAETASERVSSR